MRHLRSLLVASALMLPLAAPAALAATPAGVLVVAQNIDDIVAIDPAQAYEFTSGELVTNIYDRLVQYDAEDPTVLAPGLASEWAVDPAAKTITFTLRDGAKFHSGNPVRAEDVVFSFARVVKLNLTPAFILTQLGWTPENIAEMVKADGNKVTVKYEGDFSPAFVMNVLASRPASIVDEADGHGERGQRRHGQCLDERPFRRLGAVLAAGLPPGGAGAADRLPRLLQGRARRSTASSSATWRSPRPSSSCCSRATWTWRRT